MSLILTRRVGESFSLVQDGVETAKITVVGNMGKTRIAIDATDETIVLREEIMNSDIARLDDD